MSRRDQAARLFQDTDADNNGFITCKELQATLKNDDGTQYSEQSCKMMIKMYDRDGDGTINLEEFKQLFCYLKDWRQAFHHFDADNSGSIERRELRQVLAQLKFNFEEKTIRNCMKKFDVSNTDSLTADEFIRLCTVVHSLSSEFVNRDPEGAGSITLTQDEFLNMVFRSLI